MKKTFPSMTAIGGRGKPFIAQTIDINGDSIPEALVNLRTGGADTEYYAICQLENGKRYVAKFRNKNMVLSQPKAFNKEVSVRHEVRLRFVDDGTGKRFFMSKVVRSQPRTSDNNDNVCTAAEERI